jgi:DNA segregation ATPase FtsK/SpoIIIE, S-DNA-T family
MAVHDVRDEIRQQIKAIAMLALAALAFAALSFPRQTGEAGVFFDRVLRLLTGDMAVLVPVFFMCKGVLSILPWKIPNVQQRMGGLLLFFLILLIHAHLQVMEQELNLISGAGIISGSYQIGLAQQGGGLVGATLAVMLYFLFRDMGSKIVLSAATVIAFLLVTNISLTQLVGTACRGLQYCGRAGLRGGKKTYSFFRFVFAGDGENRGAADEDLEEEPVKQKRGRRGPKAKPVVEDNTLDVDMPAALEPVGATIIPFPSAETAASSGSQSQQNIVTGGDNPLVVEVVDKTPVITMDPAQGEYNLPPLEILSVAPRHKDGQQQKSIGERARILEQTLESFGVKARVTNAVAGPTVTRFELQPETGVKVSKIVALADDLALNLASSDVRIEAPIPGKAAVGIEVPNKVIAPVYLREVLEAPAFTQATSALTIGLGKDITGNPILADLMKMPHLLIAGSTGSGKSVCINILIASILFKARPEEVKFVMIDPKVVELNNYNGIPHLMMPVVTEAKKASLALRNMLKEMARRYELFARENVRDIHMFNELKRQQNEENELLPFIVVIIDELADLMMVAAADVEDSIARLAQMSRAAGIHLVIATQRPSVDVITGVIKANITSRIAFAVSSMADSRTILDMGGAEKLLGRGDALFHPMGASKPFRVQGAFINERELSGLLAFIKNQGEPQFAESLLPEEEDEEDFYEEDERFADAVLLLAEAGTASISLLQRRLRIGYTRAARLIDDMERRGFVGRFEGSKAREVLITPDQARKILFEEENLR